jgi:hypothetical protein
MDPAAVKEQLIAVITQIQVDSGLDCPILTGSTRPVGGVSKFDSKIWPVATTILATAIGVKIANDVNLFVNDDTKMPRSIDETAAFVCRLLAKQDEEESAVA